MIVPITQFLLPNGQQRSEKVEIPDDLSEKFEIMRELGCRLTAEVLGNGFVSVCIEHPNGDLYHELCPNGPSLWFPGGPPDAVAKMLRDFDADTARRMINELE